MKNPSTQRRTLLFLYFELAGYTVACLERLAAKYPVDIHLVRYPVNAVAPFDFSIAGGIKVYERNDYNDQGLIDLTKKVQPDLVYVCGWSDKGYMAVCKDLRKSVPVILTLDNPWLGTVKQHIASLAGPLYLKKFFTHCWVPGEPNAKYARKLGFSGKKLFTGMYSADVALFDSYYQQQHTKKDAAFPHRFIFMGRYTLLKGILELWEAFTSLSEDERGDWELWCLGKGELEDQLPKHPAVKNIGFVQPSALAPWLEQTGVFVLPAHYEHWGVAVHEFAAAGFPLICSTTTSAATAFLEEGKNGFFTTPKSTASIREVLLKIIALSDEQLIAMGRKSTEYAQRITPDTWSDTLWNIVNEN